MGRADRAPADVIISARCLGDVGIIGRSNAPKLTQVEWPLSLESDMAEDERIWNGQAASVRLREKSVAASHPRRALSRESK